MTKRGTRLDGERTRAAILAKAVPLATIEGLDGLSIGTLAEASGVSKSGVYAHFGSKQELQLATVRAARELFIEVVVIPALGDEGLARLRGLCASFLTYVENRTLPGGCFFAGAAAELGGRPGPVRELVAAYQQEWLDLLGATAREATARGEIPGDTDVDLLVFQLNAAVVAANTGFLLRDDPMIVRRAGQAVAALLP